MMLNLSRFRQFSPCIHIGTLKVWRVQQVYFSLTVTKVFEFFLPTNFYYFLEYPTVGTIITVLDKNPNLVHSTNSSLWTGVRDDTGVVGLFSPSQTVAYVNTMPTTVSAASNRKWQRGGGVTGGGPSGSEILTSDSILSVFQRASYRSLSRSSRGKLSRDMISGPRGQVQVCFTSTFM